MIVQSMRLRRGWSQQQLADISGLNVRTIQRIERGETASIESFKALGAAFNVDFSQLQEDAVREIVSTPEQTELALAFGQVRQVQQFYQRVLRDVLIVLALVAISLFFVPMRPLQGVIVPIVIVWGLLIGLHGLRVFHLLPWSAPEWEKRQVEKRLGRKL
jgi:transcriptional regulator with XRE-family HTH domain